MPIAFVKNVYNDFPRQQFFIGIERAVGNKCWTTNTLECNFMQSALLVKLKSIDQYLIFSLVNLIVTPDEMCAFSILMRIIYIINSFHATSVLHLSYKIYANLNPFDQRTKNHNKTKEQRAFLIPKLDNVVLREQNTISLPWMYFQAVKNWN